MVMSPTNSWVGYYCWIRHCTSSTSRPTNSETIITRGPVTSASITDTSSANSHPKYIVHWPQTPTEIVHIQNIKVLHHSRKNFGLYSMFYRKNCTTCTNTDLDNFHDVDRNWHWQKYGTEFIFAFIFITRWFLYDIIFIEKSSCTIINYESGSAHWSTKLP